MRKANRIISSSSQSELDSLRPTQLRAQSVQTAAKHGTNKRPRCANCKIVMRLTRREAHPARGPRHELQTYACSKCGHIEQTSTQSPGAV